MLGTQERRRWRRNWFLAKHFHTLPLLPTLVPGPALGHGQLLQCPPGQPSHRPVVPRPAPARHCHQTPGTAAAGDGQFHALIVGTLLRSNKDANCKKTLLQPLETPPDCTRTPRMSPMPSPAEVETVSAAPVPEDPAGYSWLHSLPSPDSVATTPDNSRPASPLMFNTYEGGLCNFDIDTEIHNNGVPASSC